MGCPKSFHLFVSVCKCRFCENILEIFPKIPFANNTETLIFAFMVIHGILTKIIYETEIHI